MQLELCTKIEHGAHDFLAPFFFSNGELMAFYDRINSGPDETRRSVIAEQHQKLKSLFEDPTAGHENTCFHCAGPTLIIKSWTGLSAYIILSRIILAPGLV